MGLKDRLNEDLKVAMRAQDKERLLILRSLIADIKNEGIKLGKRDELGEDEIVAVLKRAVKTRRDSIEQFTRGGRHDLVEREQFQVQVIESYLPQPMSAADVRKVVAEAIAEASKAGEPEVGVVMKAAMAKLKGKADGRTVQQLVGELLKG
ncbi:MAG: GatB/YqeY domain-containing protein [Planctomycetota bacterium]